MKEEIPKATHEGEVKVGNITLRVFHLNDGTRVIEQNSFNDFLEWLGAGGELTEEKALEIAKLLKN